MASSKAQDRFSFTAQQGNWPTFVRGEGAELITSDGSRLLDAAGGAVVNNIGHGRTKVADAVAAAMRNFGYVLPIWPTANRLELADLLVEKWLPEGFEHVAFAGSGSEANDTAIRLARLHHTSRGDDTRYKVLGRIPSYHGTTIATLGIGGHEERRAGFEPLLPDWPRVPWNDAEALVAAIESAGPETVSAFIAEPIIGGASPARIAPPEYWQRVAEICQHYGILLIADEVMTGFGRTGLRWGHEHDGWTPDILVSAKGIGGGYVPLSMLTASNRVLDPITEAGKTLMFYTYSGHDSICAGALAVLKILEREQLVERAADMGGVLIDGLRSALGGHANVVEVRGRGLMIGVELAGVDPNAVVGHAVERGVWIYPGGSSPDSGRGLLFAPPMIITEQQIERIVEVTRESIDAAR